MVESNKTQPMPENRKCPQCGTPLPEGVLGGLCPACLLKQGATPDTGTQADAVRFVPPSLEELAKFFPELEIIKLLGRGGMGAVYQARQVSLDRMIALKILPGSAPGRESGFAERFTREARALARLNHPNIVAVYEFGQKDGLHYFIMEFVDGVNLRQMQQTTRLSPREALQIIPQLCDALQYAHDQGIVHRDIKPENVLMDRKGRVKIADFGLAKIVGADTDLRLTGVGHQMGTPHYMSPEQVEHPLEVDHRADIYSLGVVFYEMLTGELPIGRFAPPSRKVEIDVRLDDVVLRALEKEPERRYQQAAEVKTGIESISQTAGVKSKPAPAPATADKVRLPARAMMFLGVFNAFVVVALFFLNHWLHPTYVAAMLLPSFLLFGLLVFLAGYKLARFQNYYFVLLGTVMTFGFTLSLCLGLPIGIWICFVLSRPAVREAFDVRSGIKYLNVPFRASTWKQGVWNWVFWSALMIVASLCGTLVMNGLATGKILELISVGWSKRTNEVQFVVRGPKTQQAVVSASTNGPPLLAYSWTFDRAQNTNQSSAPTATNFGSNLHGPSLDSNIVLFGPPSVFGAAGANGNTNATNLTWSPKLADGEKPDWSKIYYEGQRLAHEEHYEDALQRYLWFWLHRDDSGGRAGIMLWLLNDWIDLGHHYPKARQALVEIRDADERQFKEGNGYFGLFQELTSLNHSLKNEDATVNLYKQLHQSDRELADQCFPIVEEILLKRGEYAFSAECLGDPQDAFDHYVYLWKTSREGEELNKRSRERHGVPKSAPRVPEPDYEKLGNDFFIGEIRQLIEILVGVHQEDEAKKIQSQALQELDDPRLQSAVTDAQKAVAKHQKKETH